MKLLTMEQVASLVVLSGGNLVASADLADLLRSRAKGLTGDTDVRGRALKADYTEGYTAARRASGQFPRKIPTDRLIEETRQVHPDATDQELREHFMAMGVVNGIRDANPKLEVFAKLLVLYSLEMNFADLVELLAIGPLPI